MSDVGFFELRYEKCLDTVLLQWVGGISKIFAFGLRSMEIGEFLGGSNQGEMSFGFRGRMGVFDLREKTLGKQILAD